MSWAETQAVWTLGWGDGRKPGPLYFLRTRKVPGLRGTLQKVAALSASVLIGLLLSTPLVLTGNAALLVPLVGVMVWITLRAFYITRHQLASGVVRELAVTPVGAAEILRDIHLLAVRGAAPAAGAWLAGHLLWMPAGPQGLFFAVLFLCFLPPLLWRLSVLASVATVGLDSWRPTQAERRRAKRTAALALLVVVLALVFPPVLLTSIGLNRGQGLFFILIPLALIPGLSLIGGLMWWLWRRQIVVDIGKLVNLNAARVRELIERRLDL